MTADAKDLEKILQTLTDECKLTYGHAENVSEHGIAERAVAVFSFSQKNHGFGEITVQTTPQGSFVDTEHMSKERLIELFTMLLDNSILDTDMDPQRHALYNQATGRTCNDACPACATAVIPA